MKIITDNKYAYFNYTIDESLEAGVVLAGSEVKSVMNGDINLRDSFCHISEGEIWLKNCHITPYKQGTLIEADAKRDRKLLLHRREISRLIGKVREKGYTLVPTKVYVKDNKIKVQVSLARGKKLHDKRDAIKEKDILREAAREIKFNNK